MYKQLFFDFDIFKKDHIHDGKIKSYKNIMEIIRILLENKELIDLKDIVSYGIFIIEEKCYILGKGSRNMKEFISIKNFGPIKDITINEIKPFTVLIRGIG
jgi:hypothetical protein